MSVVTIRVGIFTLILFSLLILERLFPKRDHRPTGYFSNAGIFLIDAVLTRLLLAAGGVAAAAYATSKGWGFFNVLEAPNWLQIGVCVITLDFIVCVQHVATHKIPILWRLHEIHHADPHIDATTGLRFHPVEIGLSLFYKSALIMLLGAPVLAVIIFEILLNAGAMFSHSNIALPRKMDRLMRVVTVTPDMHRVHHSTDPTETDRNYGFFFPWWDYLFRTYKAQPSLGHQAMQIGVADGPRDQRLRTLLARPFARRVPSTPAQSAPKPRRG